MISVDTSPLNSHPVDEELSNLTAMVDGNPFVSDFGTSLGEIDTGIIIPPRGVFAEGQAGSTNILFDLMKDPETIPTPRDGDESWFRRCLPLIRFIINTEQELNHGEALIAFVRMQHWNKVSYEGFKASTTANNAHQPHPDAEGISLGENKGVVRIMTNNWMVSTAIGTGQYNQSYPGTGRTEGYYDLYEHCTNNTDTEPAYTADHELIRTTGVHAAQIPSDKLEVITRSFLRVKLFVPESPRFIEDK